LLHNLLHKMLHDWCEFLLGGMHCTYAVPPLFMRSKGRDIFEGFECQPCADFRLHSLDRILSTG